MSANFRVWGRTLEVGSVKVVDDLVAAIKRGARVSRV